MSHFTDCTQKNIHSQATSVQQQWGEEVNSETSDPFLSWYMQFQWTWRTNERSKLIRAKYILPYVVPAGRKRLYHLFAGRIIRAGMRKYALKAVVKEAFCCKTTLAVPLSAAHVMLKEWQDVSPLGTSLHNQAIPTGILSNKLLLAKSFLYQPHYKAPSSSECLHNSHLKKNKPN